MSGSYMVFSLRFPTKIHILCDIAPNWLQLGSLVLGRPYLVKSGGLWAQWLISWTKLSMSPSKRDQEASQWYMQT